MIPLPEDLAQHLHTAKQKKKENQKFLKNLGRKKNVDDLFHTQHDAIFERLDCLTCANCCKTTSPIFRDVDIDRISKHLQMRPSAFTEKYLHLDEDNDWVLNVAPCPFLDDKNYCTIYEVRPKACREYPHTDRKNMVQILNLTYHNTLVCPAVAQMVENIKKEIR